MTTTFARIAKAIAAIGFVGVFSGGVLAQSLEQKIDDALKPRSSGGLTRSIGVAPMPSPRAVEDQKFINRLRTRAITIEPTAEPPAAEDRAKLADIVKEKPAIDLEIFFDYNSANINPRALPALLALGKVLSKPEFQGSVYLINGHTDAAGSDPYNLVLSQRRAESVRRLLIQQFRISPDTLIAVGFGEEQLKNRGNPLADENRRVQIVNTEIKAAAR